MKFNRRIHEAGFTLVELLSVMAILSVLIAIALPSYTSYIAKARRADARAQLLQVAQFMQRFYSANDSFDKDRSDNPVEDQIPLQIKVSPSDGTPVYLLNVALSTATSYVIHMAPISGGAMTADKCGTYTLTSTGIRGVVVNGSPGNAALRDECWR